MRQAGKGPAVLGLILLVGCASPKPGGPDYLAEKHETFQGLRVAPAELRDGNERLDVFIGIPEERDQGAVLPLGEGLRFKEVLYCVAFKRDEDPLPEVAERINAAPADKPIYLYAQRIKGKYRIWWDGVDCEIKAIAVWHVAARRYVYFDTEESSMAGALARRILKGAVHEGLKLGKTALP